MDKQILIRWVPYAAALLLIAGFARLGLWQLDRASEKAALFAAFEAGQAQQTAPSNYSSLGGMPRYTSIELVGTFDPRSILLDNQTRQGKTGVHVYTPFLDSATKQAVLVNRGWLALDPARRSLPDFSTPVATQRLSGLISLPPRAGLKLGETHLESDWPQLVTYLDLPELSQALGLNLLSNIMLLSPDAPHGFEREWHPQVMGPDRHRGYAFQWFALSLTVLIVMVLLAWRYRS